MRASSALLIASVLFACASNDAVTPLAKDGGADSSIPDASAPDAADAAPAMHYPAFIPAMGQLVDHKGGTLANPKFVTVTWSSDANEGFFQAFTDAIGSSEYWKATTSEYGVGPAVSGGHVSIKTPPPATIQQSDLENWLSQQVSNAPGNGWPANDAFTVYVLYLPESLKLAAGGHPTCDSAGGYHTSTTANGSELVYAIIDTECHPQWGYPVSTYASFVGSHELVEVVTDPHVSTQAGFVGFDDAHAAWSPFVLYYEENGDSCRFNADSVVSFTSPPYFMQRSWSNASAKAGHNPCSPNPDPYFNVTPLDMVDITIRDRDVFGSIKKKLTKGYPMQVGVQASIDFGFYSDQPLPKWSVQAIEGSPFAFNTPSPTLTLALQTKSGQDGDIGTLYITPNYASPPAGTLVTLVSLGTAKHFMPFLIMVTK